MKQAQQLRRYLTTLFLLAVTTLTWAYDFAVNGIYYNKNTDGTSVTVTYRTSSYSGYSGSVVIPSTVTYDGKIYSVTSIGRIAFSYCSGLTSVTIPNSVTNIGNYAFDGCTGLTSVTIPESVTSISSQAFEGCTGLTKAEFASIESLCKIKFSNDYSNPLRYAEHLYIDGQEVTDVVIPNSITSINDYAFYGCTGLTSVTIPESVTSIGDYAFHFCSGLTSVTIGDGVTSIGSEAFWGCTGLTSVTIPNSVTNIGSYAFDVSGLTKAEFASIESLCKIKFSNFSSNPLYSAKHLYINGKEVTDVVIPNSITSINDYTFYNCSGLTSVTIGNSVTSIGNSAFRGCYGLTSVTIPNSITSIGNSTFSGCKGLTSITIPNSVTSIGESAFIDCTGLTSVTIPNSVTSIGSLAFHGCFGLTSITIPNSVTSIGSLAFEGCTSLTKAEFASIESLCKIKFSSSSSNPLYYAKHLYINGQEVTDVVIPNSVTSIGESTFYGCSGLTSVTIPNSVTSIGSGAFSGCSGLTSVTIPNSVTSIGRGAFAYCRGLTSVTIPNSITTIGDKTFLGCTGLKSITIPNSITSIGSYAFLGCSGLKYVTCHAQNVPSTDSDVFYDVPQSTATLYVPKESIDAYKSASPWKDFGTILPITPTAVESLTADEVSGMDKDDEAIYDIQGRRLQHKPTHGFYIQGGKKYFVK